MADIKDRLSDAGHKVAETAAAAGHAVAEKAGQAVDWVKDKVGMGSPASAEQIATIKPGMNVVASCGTRVGVVDHLDGSTIKLALRDSLDGLHHYVPTSWVKKVHEDHVHLSKNSEETKAGWKPSAAACADCG
ncbi:MAG TPA: DUF2171 domain-containing protein [Urbifossiella sp.]|nr:DUF2171 domain-containing protein [Urbifossiella sp.]